MRNAPRDLNGKPDGVFAILSLALGIYSGRAHESHPAVQRVEEQADILHNKGPLRAGRRGCFLGVEELLDQFLCLSNRQPAI